MCPPCLGARGIVALSQNGSGWDIVGDRQSGLWMADVAAIIRRLYKYDVKNVHMCRTQFTHCTVAAAVSAIEKESVVASLALSTDPRPLQLG